MEYSPRFRKYGKQVQDTLPKNAERTISGTLILKSRGNFHWVGSDPIEGTGIG